MKSPALPWLTRYEYCRTCGWLARYYTPTGVHQKLFSDSRYGYDPARAEHAARRWLTKYACAVPMRPRTRRRPHATNKTGRVGVCVRHKRERSGARILVYDVSYRLKGTRRTRTFRVHHYASAHEAFQAAAMFRHHMEGAMLAERRQALLARWTADPGRDTTTTEEREPCGP